MATDAVAPSGPGGPEIMAAIDADAEGRRLVIADVTAEETWLSVPEDAAALLTEWR